MQSRFEFTLCQRRRTNKGSHFLKLIFFAIQRNKSGWYLLQNLKNVLQENLFRQNFAHKLDESWVATVCLISKCCWVKYFYFSTFDFWLPRNYYTTTPEKQVRCLTEKGHSTNKHTYWNNCFAKKAGTSNCLRIPKSRLWRLTFTFIYTYLF